MNKRQRKKQIRKLNDSLAWFLSAYWEEQMRASIDWSAPFYLRRIS